MGLFDDYKKKQNQKTKLKTGLFSDYKKEESSGLDLSTSEGLLKLAEQSGLSESAEKIKKKTEGEDPNKIFSGGTIRDIFDVSSAWQYASAGAVRAKQEGQSIWRGIKSGIQNRTSFVDVVRHGKSPTTPFSEVSTEEKKKRIWESTLGTAADIFFDPLNLLGIGIIGKAGKAEKLLKIADVVSKSKKITTGETLLARIKLGTGKTLDIAEKLPIVGGVFEKGREISGRAFVYRFGQDPIYKKLAEKRIINIGVGTKQAKTLTKPIAELDVSTQKIIAEARKSGKLEILSPEILTKAKPAFDKLDELGKRAVNAGLLDAQIYKENFGKYMARLYRTKEAPEGIMQKFFDKKPLRTNLSRFMKRKDIPEEIRNTMGEILEAGYPTGKSIAQLNQAVETTEFFNKVVSKWAVNELKDGFQELPKTKNLGTLAGKYVPKSIYDDIQEIIKVKTPTEKTLGKFVGAFKFGKVVMNPATHARNIMSNFILNDFEGLAPIRLDIYGQAATEIAKKGKLYQEARNFGLGVNTFAAQEINDLFINNGKTGNKVVNALKGTAKKLSSLYQGEEELAKMAQYIYRRGLGNTAEEAMKISERATFNYAQVTPFVRRLRESLFGFPFITFTYKATPQIVTTAITKPGIISKYGKMARGIESLTTPEELKKEKETEPSWMKSGFYVRMPNKDKYNRTGYFDLTYILPFGDLMSGNLFETQKEKGQTIIQAALSKSPALNIIQELSKNEDFYGNKIVKPSSLTPEKQGGDIMSYLTKQYGPALLNFTGVPGGQQGTLSRSLQFQQQGEEKPLEAETRTTRTIPQELLRTIVGIKTQPFNISREQTRKEKARKQQLADLLEQYGITRNFDITYVPKK